MKVIYLAGKNLNRANRVAATLEASGYSIPCNWYYNYKDDETNFSPEDEVQAIRTADFWYIYGNPTRRAHATKLAWP